MKITKQQLKQIIQEELARVLSDMSQLQEQDADAPPRPEQDDDSGETHGSGSEDILTPGKKAKSKPLPKDPFKGKPKRMVPVVPHAKPFVSDKKKPRL